MCRLARFVHRYGQYGLCYILCLKLRFTRASAVDPDINTRLMAMLVLAAVVRICLKPV